MATCEVRVDSLVAGAVGVAAHVFPNLLRKLNVRAYRSSLRSEPLRKLANLILQISHKPHLESVWFDGSGLEIRSTLATGLQSFDTPPDRLDVGKRSLILELPIAFLRRRMLHGTWVSIQPLGPFGKELLIAHLAVLHRLICMEKLGS